MNTQFDGITFDPQRDGARLSRLLDKVRLYMSDANWHTLSSIAEHCGGSEASVSARLRDLRKPQHSGYTIERSNAGAGLWLYRMQPRK